MYCCIEYTSGGLPSQSYALNQFPQQQRQDPDLNNSILFIQFHHDAVIQ